MMNRGELGLRHGLVIYKATVPILPGIGNVLFLRRSAFLLPQMTATGIVAWYD